MSTLMMETYHYLHPIVRRHDRIVGVDQRALAASDGNCRLQHAALRPRGRSVGCDTHATNGIGSLVLVLYQRDVRLFVTSTLLLMAAKLTAVITEAARFLPSPGSWCKLPGKKIVAVG